MLNFLQYLPSFSTSSTVSGKAIPLVSGKSITRPPQTEARIPAKGETHYRCRITGWPSGSLPTLEAARLTDLSLSSQPQWPFSYPTQLFQELKCPSPSSNSVPHHRSWALGCSFTQLAITVLCHLMTGRCSAKCICRWLFVVWTLEYCILTRIKTTATLLGNTVL